MPGYLSPPAGVEFADVPNDFVVISVWNLVLARRAFCEVSQDHSADTVDSKGDFGFKVSNSSDPAAKRKKLASVLSNDSLE